MSYVYVYTHVYTHVLHILAHKALLKLVRRARDFFAPSAASELMDELRMYMCPHELSLFRAVGFLVWYAHAHTRV